MNIKWRLLTLALFITTTLNAQSAGDFLFIGFNADGDDDFAIVAMNDLPDTDFIFTESVWQGTSFSDQGTDYFVWSTGGTIKAGRVVVFTDVDASTSRTVSIGSISSEAGTFNLNATGDAIWALHVAGSDTNFISAITNDEDEFDGDLGTLSGTGLTLGITAVDFSNGFASPDGGIYSGFRQALTNVDFRVLIGNATNWDFDNSDGEQYLPFDTTAFRFTSSVIIEGSAGWRLLSFPITGGTVSDISDDTAIQGIPGGDHEAAFPNFIIYDSSGSYDIPDDVSTPFGDGLGFALYFFDNSSNGSSELPLELDIVGSELVGDIAFPINSGSPNLFTLIGNPFPVNINTKDLSSSGGDISDNISFWDNASGSYQVHDRTSDTGFVAAPWQAFWVETADAGVNEISISLSSKSGLDTTAAYFRKSANRVADIEFSLQSPQSRDDAIRMAFREYASVGFDRADATKLIPLQEKYAIMGFKNDSVLKSVESIPFDFGEEITRELQLQTSGITGEFIISWKGVDSVPAGWSVALYDHEKDIVLDMRTTDHYQFQVDDQATKTLKGHPSGRMPGVLPATVHQKAASRFGIQIISGKKVHAEETEKGYGGFKLQQNYPNPFNPSTTISYSLDKTGWVRLEIFNLVGQKVAELVNGIQPAGDYQLVWEASAFPSGLYYYKLEGNGENRTRIMTLIK